MTLDKEDIATANEMARALQKSKNSELVVVGNLLAHLLAERSPQRQWVGLNWHEMPEIYMNDKAFEHGAQWAEAKLKEKNNG